MVECPKGVNHGNKKDQQSNHKGNAESTGKSGKKTRFHTEVGQPKRNSAKGKTHSTGKSKTEDTKVIPHCLDLRPRSMASVIDLDNFCSVGIKSKHGKFRRFIQMV